MHHCYLEPQESFFLQRKNCPDSPSSKVLSPVSKLQEKKSLKTLKKIKSQKSLRTIDSEHQQGLHSRLSSKNLAESQNTAPSTPQLENGPKAYESSFKYYMDKAEASIKESRSRMRMQKKNTAPFSQPTPRISFRFGSEENVLRKFLSPEPIRVMQRPQVRQAPQIPQIPLLRLSSTEQPLSRSKIQELDEYIQSITVRDSSFHYDRLDTIRQTSKDWDMKSTHHVDQTLVERLLPLPQMVKSTISFCSDESEEDSIVMDRMLPASGTLTKLI